MGIVLHIDAGRWSYSLVGADKVWNLESFLESRQEIHGMRWSTWQAERMMTAVACSS